MDPFLGEIRMFVGDFAPKNWAFCHGQLLPIAANNALYSLLGTTYGGDGRSTFALPDLRGRTPLHQGNNPNTGVNYSLGQTGGAETVKLRVSEIPQHTHTPQMNANPGTASAPTNNVWAATAVARYTDQAPSTALDYNAIGGAGGNQPHDNMPPFQTINYIIAIYGVYPNF